jgi:hypothetical protein
MSRDYINTLVLGDWEGELVLRFYYGTIETKVHTGD